MVTRVVCLGGGYAGVNLGRGLKKQIIDGTVDLKIVSRDNFHTFHGFVHEMLTGKVQPSQIISPARRIFPPAQFYNCEIESIDLKAKTVTASRLLDGRQYVLEYDHLVLALGSVDDLTRYAGISEHAQRVKTYAECFRTRNHILSMLELAEIETDPVERRRLLTFVVAGGGFGGVEIATEIHHFVKKLTKREYARVPVNEIRTVLVHSGERLLPEFEKHPKLIDWCEKEIEHDGVEIHRKARISAATAEEVILNTGERISSRTIISCTGTVPAPLVQTLEIEHDARGRAVTDEFLRVKGAQNVWAAGDCAAVPNGDGGTCPPLGLFALVEGTAIANNIKATMAGTPLTAFNFAGLGLACSIGPFKAATTLRGMVIKGVFAWFAWRMLLLVFVPTWDRKVRLALDWLVSPLVGRDIVNMKVEPQYGMRRELFEVGQEIVRQGEVGRRMYLIWSGEVEIVREELDGTSTVLATLTSGQHFGEIAIFQDLRRTATVRAKTRVELLSIGQAEALALTQASSAFGNLRNLPQSAPVAARPE